jgi:two-component system sensor histidine kinase KdpD
MLSEQLLNAVAERVGFGLARLDAIQRATEAAVVRRTDELKSAVLDAMAHEIRNPLNSAKIAATALVSEHAGGELDRREMLTIIDEELDRTDRSSSKRERGMARFFPSEQLRLCQYISISELY